MDSTGHHTFDKACEQWPDIENIWTPLGWPDHLHNFNVLWNGSLLAMPDLNRRTKKWAGMGTRVTPCPAWHGWIAYFYGGWNHDDNSVRQGWTDAPAPVLWSEYACDGVITRSEIFAYVAGGGGQRELPRRGRMAQGARRGSL